MDNREKILQYALNEFLQKGYEKASISNICEHSQISKGGLYHHFKNKDELFWGCLELFLQQLRLWMDELFADELDLRNFLKKYFGILPQVKNQLAEISGMEGLSEYNYYLLIMDGIEHFSELKEQISGFYDQLKAKSMQLLQAAKSQNLVRLDIDNEQTSYELLALFEGSLVLSILNNQNDLERRALKLSESFWQKISKAETEDK
ncbi:MAG: TetR/AcrR family transcriptional regulator [Candidatus Cloacimonadales bacterium]